MVRAAALVVVCVMLAIAAPSVAQWVPNHTKGLNSRPHARPPVPIDTLGWTEFVTGKDGSGWYLQNEGLAKNTAVVGTDYRKIWVMVDYTRVPNMIAKSFKGLLSVNCSLQQTAWYSSTYFSARGDVMSSVSPGISAREEYIIPGSILAVLTQRVCPAT